MEEGLVLTCGACGRNVVGTQAQKGARLCRRGCGVWVRNRPNLLIRFWRLLRDN